MHKLVPLKFVPGFTRDLTRFAGENGWYEGDKVRFSDGFPETIGGWQKATNETFLGTCRSLTAWVGLNSADYIGLGTTFKYYILSGGQLNDITPIRSTTSAGDVTFAATNGSTTITVSDTAHGAVLNDFVTFSGAVSLGGTVTAEILNTEHQVTSIVDDNSYEIEVAVAANASDVGNGGASVVGEYQVNVGLNANIGGTGWGADPWGSGGWGEAGVESAAVRNLRIWSAAPFGEDLIANPSDGAVYYWDASLGVGTRAVNISTLAGATSVPQVAKQVIVSSQDRHVLAFGCDDEFNPGVQDPLLIRWSDQENAAAWNTSTTTTAGSLRLPSGSSFVTAVQTKREILVFTNESVHSLQYIGDPFYFGMEELSRGIQIAGSNAAVAINDVVYWMGNGKFMGYDGVVQPIKSPVEDFVFGDFNEDQRRKVFAGANTQFGEVWWFYPSGSSEENDRYVVYNYEENIWYFGTLDRTAWLASGLPYKPLATDDNGCIFQHEVGANDGSQNPPVAINAYIESSTLDLGDGDRFFFSKRIIPDLTFAQSTSGSPAATMSMKAKRFPGATFHSSDGNSTVRTATAPVEQFTEQLHIRLRGRSFAFRVESNQEGTAWRLGVPRVELRSDGGR